MTNITFENDVFLSYSSIDLDIVLEVYNFLSSNGIKVWLDRKSVRIGQPIANIIEKELERSRVLMYMMSKDAFESQYSTMERQAVQFRDPSNQLYRYFPVRLDGTPIPVALAQYKYVDLQQRTQSSLQYLLDELNVNLVETRTAEERLRKGPLADHQQDSTKKEPLKPAVSRLQRMLIERIGKEFEILECVSDDDEEAIFRAKDRTLRRDVAVKSPILPPYEADDIASRFSRKMRDASLVTHRNIVPIHAGLTMQGLPIMVTGFVRGLTISELISRTGAQPLRRIRDLLLNVGLALEYSHRRGAHHHRLNPANILIDDEGEAVVTPMEFARAPISNSKSELRKVAYSAPEQFVHRDCPEARDQYSLGLICYEMLVGKPVVDIRSVANVSRSKKEFHNPPSPSEFGRLNCPPLLWKILLKLLAPIPHDRFRSLSSMIEEVHRLDDDALGLRHKNGDRKQRSDEKALKIAQQSLKRCRLDQNFIQSLYLELRKHPEVDSLFRNNNDFRPEANERHHWLIRESLDLLLAFGEEPDSAERNVLTEVASRHRKLNVTQSMYDVFEQALLHSVKMTDIFNRDNLTENSIIVNAWKSSIRRGLEYLKVNGSKNA